MTTKMEATFADIDPATGETVANVPIASAEEVRAAIRAARASQPGFARLSFADRAKMLRQGCERVKACKDELARMVSREMGKPLADAEGEIVRALGSFERVLGEIEVALAPEVLPSEGHETRVVRDALGVVAAITPWNFPVLMPIEIFLPALAAGNTVVFKPSELVPLTGALLAERMASALPREVLITIQGPGETGAELVAGDVNMIAFVGSRDTGKRIMRSASGGLKRLVLELGGKDPLVVFADADLEAAADATVLHSLRNTGQVCCSVERVYVEDRAAEEFERLVLERARKWNHGNGLEEDVRMGPLVSAEQRDKVIAQVEDAKESGARLLLGGEVPSGKGFFYPATVLADVAEDRPLARQETFGPVISLSRFNGDEDEAVRLANDTPYGLGANVFSGDVERGRNVAARIRSGQVGVNRYLSAAPSAPWVGAGESGFGFLGGADGYRQFTIPKSISYPV